MSSSRLEISIESLSKKFKRSGVEALSNISAKIKSGCVTGIVGPDGAGKTTLLRLLAGLLKPSSGSIEISGQQISNIREILSYMPQRFGLYEDLTVIENLTLYSDLHGMKEKEKKESFARLLSFTGLAPFKERYAGNLSGGMKQKLGLACCLISTPLILLLDEPSVGVDPISRNELWQIVNDISRGGVTILWSTSYLDEAEKCSEVLLLDEGRLLYKGNLSELSKNENTSAYLVELKNQKNKRRFALECQKREDILDCTIQGSRVRIVMRDYATSTPQFEEAVSVTRTTSRFEDAFIKMTGGMSKEKVISAKMGNIAQKDELQTGEVIVEAKGLTKKFGNFTAVDGVSFKVGRGEVFGLLGPNGAGKSTIFKMMCGLLKATSGWARISGIDLLNATAKAREKIGYMAQKFSLYGDLKVIDNLNFFGGIYGLKGEELKNVVFNILDGFQLSSLKDEKSNNLPLGFKQRLSLACAIMHNPTVLFLDEPTSGVDPMTRREFWGRINTMVEGGVSIIVTTHFIDEAEYCDRIALIYAGKIIACETPDEIKRSVVSDEMKYPTLETAFIELIKLNSKKEIDD